MIKKIFITLLALIVLLIVGIGIFLATFDLNHYRDFAQKQLSKALNYPVQIGSMRTKLSLIPTIQISNFKVFQNGENPKVILDVPQIEANLEILPLFKKKIEIARIDVLLVSVDLSLLSTSKEETSEKKEKKKTSTSSSTDLVNQLWVEEITIDRLLCRFMNKGEKEAFELNKFSLKGLNKFKFQVAYANNKVDIEGSSGLLTRLIQNPKSLPIDLRIKQNNASLALKGQIGDLPNLDKIRVDVRFTALKLASFLKMWNVIVPKILDVNTNLKFSMGGNLQKMTLKGINLDINKKSFLMTADGQATQLDKNPSVNLNTKLILSNSNFAQKLNLKPFEMTTGISADKKSVSLTTINFRAGRSDISGDIKVNLGDVPTIEPNLSSSYLSLRDILNDQQSTTTTSATTASETKGVKSPSLIPNTKIDWSILDKFNLKGKIDINHMFLTDQISDYLNVVVTSQLEKGHLALAYKGRILTGNISGNVDLNANQKGAILKFAGQGLDLDKIRSIDKTIKGAKVNTDISLNSKGDTVKNLASNLNGNITVELLGGTIMDKWFNSLPSTLSKAKQKSGLLDFSTADQKTDIVCGAVNMPIANGIIKSDEKIALQTDALNFIAKGQINLRNETLDLTIVPSVNQTRGMANQLLTTVQSVHLKGPWQNIEPTVDANQAIGNIAQIAAQKLTGQKPQIVTSTALCQNVLGKKLQQAPTRSTTPKQNHTMTQTTQSTKKENLKQQLIQSLSQALQNKAKK